MSKVGKPRGSRNLTKKVTIFNVSRGKLYADLFWIIDVFIRDFPIWTDDRGCESSSKNLVGTVFPGSILNVESFRCRELADHSRMDYVAGTIRFIARDQRKSRLFEKQVIHLSPMELGGRMKMWQQIMLCPRSANAKHSSIPGNSQGIRNLPGSPSFLGNLFKMTAEQCSFIEVRARQGSLEVRATSLELGSFHYLRSHALDMEEITEGLVVLARLLQLVQSMGSRTGVVIGSGPTGGWNGCSLLVNKLGCTWSLRHLGSVPDPEVDAVSEMELRGGNLAERLEWCWCWKLGSYVVYEHAQDMYLCSSATSDWKQLGEWVELNEAMMDTDRPSLEWIERDMSMRSSLSIDEELLCSGLRLINPWLQSKIVCHNFRNKDASASPLGGVLWSN
ncbi:hypothetical protein Tco_0993097 [Tanacetum coccineum]|uniref:Uncharacterized protein n=1 Tax=Tanacetum coccineum TaxID=301880 RepID=A0ABQ5F4N6_9ASTR